MAVLSKPRCMFLELPPELRNRIYDMVLSETEPVLIHTNDYTLPGFLKSCKFVHEEAIKLYYATVSFEFDRGNGGDKNSVMLTRWLETLPSAYRAVITIMRCRSHVSLPAEGHVDEMWNQEKGAFMNIILGLNRQAAEKVLGAWFEKKHLQVPWVKVGEKKWDWLSLEAIEEG